MEETKTYEAFIGKLLKAINACGMVEKDARNDYQKYDYASIQAIARAGRKALADNGLALLPSATTFREDKDTVTPDGKTHYMTRIRKQFILTDGIETHVFEVDADGADTGDKGIYKALTGARKYALQFVLQMEIGDDAEDDTGEPEIKPPNKPSKKSPLTVLQFGSCKGQDVGEIDGKNLAWYRGVLTDNVNDPEKSKFRAKNQELLDAINAEVERRKASVEDDIPF